jgi:16S rRNA (cytosine967-C5)-methyltransferase
MTAPARAAAYRALRIVATADLGDTLARTRDPLADPRDRALATDLVTGTLRWRGAIDFQLERLTGKPLDRLDPEVLDVLRLGAYQLLQLERLPASAVVNDSVNLVKAARVRSAAPLVNAVLRRLARERDALVWPATEDAVAHLSVVHSHPAWLVQRWIERFGAETALTWLRFNNAVPALTLAANRNRIDRDALAKRLGNEGVQTEPTAFAPHGLRVTQGRALASPSFQDGLCLVQDEASQLVTEVVAAPRGTRVLDACAAPGGKTVALAAQVGSHGLVVATDVRARRMRALCATLARCRAGNVQMAQIGARTAFPFRGDAFNVVLVDAPCSGLGTVRRDPDIKWKRQPEDLPRFAEQQVDLLHRVSRLVAPGGRLVYSTCSSEPEENEDAVDAFLDRAAEFSLEPLDTSVSSSIRSCVTPRGLFRSDPARHGLEAFFAAALRRV